MVTIAAQEIKRRGITAVDELLARGPVHIVKNNRPTYVIISEKDYGEMLSDLSDARIAAAEADYAAGRFRRGTAKQLMREILKEKA